MTKRRKRGRLPRIRFDRAFLFWLRVQHRRKRLAAAA